MLFNSFNFGLFLPVVLLLYWSIGFSRRKYQNLLLLAASYFFYGLWDWRFLSLIFASSIIDYFVGIWLESTTDSRKRKGLLWISVIWNLGVLFVFKYYNFFVAEFADLFNLSQENFAFSSLQLILPVGLSFYTFQTLSYSIDVYRGTIKATRNSLNFLCFVSFFPQLVAGPIERAKNLLPQFSKDRKFDLEQFKDGMRQVLWGLFKKIVIADNAAVAVNAIYGNVDDHGSLTLLYATAMFFFQIYCDFSGYSDIAIGTAKMFGFRLSTNFNIPYLARSVAEFWQRWHITLTKWFTDYVYGPIASKNRNSALLRAFAMFITMGLIGLWHGANWTFIVFGLFQAIMITIERLPIKVKNSTVNLNYYLVRMPLLFAVFYSFTLILTSCVFFRAESMTMAWSILERIVTLVPSDNFSLEIGNRVWFVILLVAIEFFTRTKKHPFVGVFTKFKRPLRWALYYLFIFFIFRYAGPKEEFIYFQF
ncbi:MAG: MBOAT family O-acyltransferase [Gilvibacter sp.]